jgi:hypothetical protein
MKPVFSAASKDSEDGAKIETDDTQGTWHNGEERNSKGREAEVGKEKVR